MLLHGQARLIGPVVSAPPTFVALHDDGDQAIIVGRASTAVIVEAASMVDEILVASEDQAWVADALPDWRIESAILYLRSEGWTSPSVPNDEVRFLAEGELAKLTHLPESLHLELCSAERSGAPIAVAWEGTHPAAFGYAGSMTETLWDVSVDTLAPYRRRGHAVRAVSFLIAHYGLRGKRPVWGALTSNNASRALAARLGFVPVGSLSIFATPEGR
jgi:hypothetical protein